MKIVTPDEMRRAEQLAFCEYGVSSLVMMENAAQGFCTELQKHYGSVKGTKISVFCGAGNNGGDGFAIARLLSLCGAKCSIITEAETDRLFGDARTNFDLAMKFGIPILRLLELTKPYDIAIDALYGIGFHGRLSDIDKKITEAINCAPFVASVDMPSGASAENGTTDESCVRSDLTITFGKAKLGQYLYPAKEMVGKLVTTPISIPQAAWEEPSLMHETITEDMFRFLPKRRADSHKGSYGKVLVLGGSNGMCGAAVMASVAVLKTGAGMATLATPDVISELAMKKLTEVMVMPLKSAGDTVSKEAYFAIKERLSAQDVLLMGCGLGRSEDVSELIHNLAQESDKPMVIDADGINAIAENIHVLKQRKAAVILTPHAVEFSRLIGKNPEEWQAERVSVARRFATEYQVVLVLKGADSLVACPDGRVFVNTVSNSGMATAGSGDVLAGIISGLLAQGATAEHAACVGVHLHTLCGAIAKAGFGEYSMCAGDILSSLPQAMMTAVKSKE